MSVQPPSTTPAPSKGNRTVVVVLLVIAVILAVIAALLLQDVASRHHRGAAGSQTATSTTASADTGHSATAVPEPTPAPPVADQQTLEIIHSETHRDPADTQAKGKVDAPVVMVVYSDFACPYCTQFAQNVEPELADLVDKGTLRIEWRDLAQISPTSPLAAQAGRAAAKQGKFWEFHDAVYAAADPSGHPQYSEQALVDFAATAGVPDLDKFRATMLDAHTVAKVTSAKEQAHQAGITGTPTLFINKAYIPGFRDASYVRNTVLAQAAEAAS